MYKPIKHCLNKASKIVAILFLVIHPSFGQNSLKREFRGVWIASVANIDWPSGPNLSTEKQREEFRTILNHHQKNGINAVIVQIRPNADALYRSNIEPWSAWLTGSEGKSPDPEYDPLTFMIEEAHERCMEFHAWLNPYRAVYDAGKFYGDSTHIHLDSLKAIVKELIESDSSNANGGLADHDYKNLVQLLELDTSLLVYKHPEWFLQYGNKIYFDPGIPEVQNHITSVVRDIVRRYDVDAIHMDDYFYPYKIAGIDFPDSISFAKYGSTYSTDLKDFWRRENVNTIVKMLNEAIKKEKPFVKFGISPFGVWRNAHVDPAGSNTKAGQTNYDDLYADILKWQKEKWIDYIIPQIYWYRGFNLADYEVLVKWWNDNHFDVHVYIGHGLYRVDGNSTVEAWRNPDEIPGQIDLNRSLPNIQGSCFFSSKSLVENPLGVSDNLQNNYYQFPAIIPKMSWLGNTALEAPQIIEAKNNRNGIELNWKGNRGEAYYVVYRFKGKSTGDIKDPSNILAIQAKTRTFFQDSDVKRFRKYTYAISSLDRLYNESELSVPVTRRWKKTKNR
ncbi:MAG: family 10 glycosylhydrolase [Cytophagales bacterium]|nr:family 10 glycosylhydrolase [Cytophagales bacterium]